MRQEHLQLIQSLSVLTNGVVLERAHRKLSVRREIKSSGFGVVVDLVEEGEVTLLVKSIDAVRGPTIGTEIQGSLEEAEVVWLLRESHQGGVLAVRLHRQVNFEPETVLLGVKTHDTVGDVNPLVLAVHSGRSQSGIRSPRDGPAVGTTFVRMEDQVVHSSRVESAPTLFFGGSMVAGHGSIIGSEAVDCTVRQGSVFGLSIIGDVSTRGIVLIVLKKV